jgi:hypothetical protein
MIILACQSADFNGLIKPAGSSKILNNIVNFACQASSQLENSLPNAKTRGYYRPMRLYKSKGLALFLLIAMCGQVAAYPLLMCPDMDSMPKMNSTAEQSLSHDHHANHGADQASLRDEAENHICKLCVSCSSVSTSEYASPNSQLISDLKITSYTNPLPNSSLENPFRPPIAT